MIHGIFTPAYVQQEIEWYDTETYLDGGIDLITMPLHMNVVEYLNKWWWLEGELSCPVFRIDGKTWMSLTPMEIQSMALPYHMAEGLVGTSGLGMGYFALKCAEDDCVDKVHVWEIDERVIKFFQSTFHDRDGYEKIIIHHDDVANMKDVVLDFFFADHYQSLACDQSLVDAVEIPKRNVIGTYRWWGMEKILANPLMEQLTGDEDDPENKNFDWMESAERAFFSDWLRSERDISVGEPVAIHTLFDPIADYPFVEKALEVMGRTELMPAFA